MLQKPSVSPGRQIDNCFFLETASDTPLQSATSQRTQNLRAAIGVRSPARWCTVDGTRIAWEDIGSLDKDAQVILCLHAAGSGSREFRPLTTRYPIGSRLILVDWPGHGRSGELSGADSENQPALTVEACTALVQALSHQLEIEKPILLGSGFGAAVALRYAADHPEHLRGVVLCLPAGLVPAASTGPFSQRGRRGVSRLLGRLKRAVSGKTRSGSEIGARWQALRMEVLRPAMQSMRAAAQISVQNACPGLRAALDSLSCPALFALSHASREYPLRRYLALLDPSLAWAPKYQFTVFAGAFHPLWDEPEHFALALTSFVHAQLPVEMHTHAWMLNAVDWPTTGTNLWKCVHPDCAAERVLAAGLNANKAPRPGTKRK